MKVLRHLRPAAHLALPFNDSICGPCLLKLRSRTYHNAAQTSQSSRIERSHQRQHGAQQAWPRHDSNQTRSSANLQQSAPPDDLQRRVASIVPVNIINADPSKLTIAPTAARVFKELNIHPPMLQVINARKLGLGYSVMRHHEIHIYHAHHFGPTEAMLDHWISHYRQRSEKESLWLNAASRPWGKECFSSVVVQTRAVKRVKHAFIEVLAKLGYNRFGRTVEEGKKDLYGTFSWRIGDAKTCCKVKYTELVTHIEEVMRDKIKVLLGECKGKGSVQKSTGPPRRGQDKTTGKEKAESRHDRSNTRSDKEDRRRGSEGQSKRDPSRDARDAPRRQRTPNPGHEEASF